MHSKTNKSLLKIFNLDHRLEKAIKEANYEIPTPVQIGAIPIVLSGKDIISTAQTGNRQKLLRFVLPILEHILKKSCSKTSNKSDSAYSQPESLLNRLMMLSGLLGKYTRIRTATVLRWSWHEGRRKNALRTGADVIIACPGRLLDHMGRGYVDFSKVEKVVLDEADRMLDMGFLPPIRQILEKLPANRHSMLFSATFGDDLTDLANETLNDPKRIDIDLCAPAVTVSHTLYPCPQHLKTPLLLELLKKMDVNSVLIFTRTKHRANKVAEKVAQAGYKTAALHANKSQSQRQLAMNDFRKGRCQILVATDIASRGLDVDTISHVINYDIPDTANTYIHRIGRTGRAQREGDALTLITKDDRGIIFEIEKTLGSRIERIKLEDFNYDLDTPKKDEFKRAPLAKPKLRVELMDNKMTVDKRTGEAKLKPQKSPGFFANKRMKLETKAKNKSRSFSR